MSATGFVLVVYFMLGGEAQEFIIDGPFSREDCGRAIVAGVESVVLDSGTKIGVPEHHALACELAYD